MKSRDSEPYGPRGDASRHLPLSALEEGLAKLSPAPKECGRVELIVRRRADGERETPARLELSRAAGVPGDRWERMTPDARDHQLAVMQVGLAALVANGQPLTLFGDNLFVDLDLSAGNLPAGTRIRVGEAVVEMTPEPHDGCHKFASRFGPDALRFVAAKATRAQNRRGVYWTTVESGAVAVGDAVRILGRPPRSV